MCESWGLFYVWGFGALLDILNTTNTQKMRFSALIQLKGLQKQQLGNHSSESNQLGLMHLNRKEILAS